MQYHCIVCQDNKFVLQCADYQELLNIGLISDLHACKKQICYYNHSLQNSQVH